MSYDPKIGNSYVPEFIKKKWLTGYFGSISSDLLPEMLKLSFSHSADLKIYDPLRDKPESATPRRRGTRPNFTSFATRTPFPEIDSRTVHQDLSNMLLRLEARASAVIDRIETAVLLGHASVSLTQEDNATLRHFLYVASYRKRSPFGRRPRGGMNTTGFCQLDDLMEETGTSERSLVFYRSLYYILTDSPEELLSQKRVLGVDRGAFFYDCEERELAIYVAPDSHGFVLSENGMGLAEWVWQLVWPWTFLASPLQALRPAKWLELAVFYPITPRILVVLLPPKSLRASVSAYPQLTMRAAWGPSTYFRTFPIPISPPTTTEISSGPIQFQLLNLSVEQVSQVNRFLIEYCDPKTKVAYSSFEHLKTSVEGFRKDSIMPITFPRNGRPKYAMLKDCRWTHATIRVENHVALIFRWWFYLFGWIYPIMVYYGVWRLVSILCASWFGMSLGQTLWRVMSYAWSITVGWPLSFVASWLAPKFLWSLTKKVLYYGPWCLGVVVIGILWFG
ncbi:uncharacterized protein STEHIDRAFT_106605 [Stereum hirsutum FP-91666 SS1]|uniref:uncharacterized protein n=1 Tax=Stereum hirsutum (strain FP-91666) TaxID=721885 RepID=UPI000440E0E2|nr:uncharacterized protein STEHIDRAFT_106605 [Stereum hirsutum FP-91666 SS1]EIM91929.1 hypothetical protein STEHIDRAFT_106605 [Stereum hirsutum FP-91666 SS1]